MNKPFNQSMLESSRVEQVDTKTQEYVGIKTTEGKFIWGYLTSAYVENGRMKGNVTDINTLEVKKFDVDFNNLWNEVCTIGA
jgi:hypothetical protein